MLHEKINEMIMSALKDKKTDRANTYRLIKSEFLKFTTAKNAKPLDKSAEISILQKMVKQREDANMEFVKANRMDLVASNNIEINIIEELLPAAPTNDEIVSYINYWYADGIDKKDMGKVIKEIKDKFIGADGKLVSEIVKQFFK